jgi:RNA polymerase sigma-70 factor (ECF subfamily)
VVDPPYRPGSPEDFDRLYRDSHDRILRTLLGVLRDRTAAEECTQETFVRAYRAWARWRPEAPAEAWLHRIALHVAASHRRREALRTLGTFLRRVGPPPGEPSATERAEAADLLAALRRMHPQQAAIIVLRHHHGYSNREIATALGVPESTVSSRLAAAKKRVREELGEAEPARAPAFETKIG